MGADSEVKSGDDWFYLLSPPDRPSELRADIFLGRFSVTKALVLGTCLSAHDLMCVPKSGFTYLRVYMCRV